MPIKSSVLDLVLIAAAAGAGRHALRNYRALPEPPTEGRSDYGHVSIIVPARNEAVILPRLLESLLALSYQDADILVVDDGSTDQTAAVARSLGVPVLRVDLPAGWSGKSHACWVGAQHTHGEWLLFCDADTQHACTSLNRVLALAVEESVDVVSLLARQECPTFWERVLLPYIYFLYFVGARHINQRANRSTANGQYILCKRDSYQRFGGHRAVRSSLVEDVALARVAARNGHRVVLARGESMLRVRMYDGLSAIWLGFGKNSFRFVRLSPTDGAITVASSVLFATLLLRGARAKSRSARIALPLVPALSMLPWYRAFGVPARYVAGFPLAAAVFQLIALDSIRRTLIPGATTWKGRRY